MADGLILEFEGFGIEKYKQVNTALGVNFDTGEGAPEGQIFHCGAAKAGGLVVFEIWRSKEDQERFMQERLGKALQESGVTDPPSRMEWLEVAATYSLD